MGLAPTDRVRLRIPRPLTVAQKNALLVGVRVTPEEPIKLNARDNFSGDSFVAFYSPHTVSGASDSVSFGTDMLVEDHTVMRPPHEGASASVLFKFANRSNAHLVDICVYALPNGSQATFTLTGAVNETRTVAAGLQHLTSLLPANSGRTAQISVSCNEAWSFQFAELTAVA